MSERSSLPDSLRWRAVRWMEMGLSQADDAGRFDVSPSVVHHRSVASGRRTSSSAVRRRLHNSGLYARRPVVCVPLNRRQRRVRLSWATERVFWTRQRWASVLFIDESRFTLESYSGRLLIWRE
ncbi:transposable element Tcb2 transposase [Trichonephila clavipes]|nr:transposable element Tcb2 transposase [Trichonephila clavipes]